MKTIRLDVWQTMKESFSQMAAVPTNQLKDIVLK